MDTVTANTGGHAGSSSRGSPMSERRRTRVLCVDDHPDVVHTLATLFNLSGFEARECPDGPAALAVAPDFRPHACVVDINRSIGNWVGTGVSIPSVVRPVSMEGRP